LFAHGGDTEGDVLFERDAELLGAFADVFAVDAFGESFIFQAALHGIYLEIKDAFRGADVGAGGEETGEFVASEKSVFERGLARDAGIIGVGEDGADDFVGVAALAEDFRAFRGMLPVGRVIVIGPTLVIEIVKECGEAPELFVGALFAGVGADTGLHGKHVLAKTFRGSEFAKELPGVIASGHAVLRVEKQIV
jgi:hypothetical protein